MGTESEGMESGAFSNQFPFYRAVKRWLCEPFAPLLERVLEGHVVLQDADPGICSAVVLAVRFSRPGVIIWKNKIR